MGMITEFAFASEPAGTLDTSLLSEATWDWLRHYTYQNDRCTDKVDLATFARRCSGKLYGYVIPAMLNAWNNIAEAVSGSDDVSLYFMYEEGFPFRIQLVNKRATFSVCTDREWRKKLAGTRRRVASCKEASPPPKKKKKQDLNTEVEPARRKSTPNKVATVDGPEPQASVESEEKEQIAESSDKEDPDPDHIEVCGTRYSIVKYKKLVEQIKWTGSPVATNECCIM